MGLRALCHVLLGHVSFLFLWNGVPNIFEVFVIRWFNIFEVFQVGRFTKTEKMGLRALCKVLLGHVAPPQTVWGPPGTCSTRLDSIKITPQKNQTKKMSKK